MELENAARSPEEIIADEARKALRYETSARVCRSIMTHVCSVINKQSCIVKSLNCATLHNPGSTIVF